MRNALASLLVLAMVACGAGQHPAAPDAGPASPKPIVKATVLASATPTPAAASSMQPAPLPNAESGPAPASAADPGAPEAAPSAEPSGSEPEPHCKGAPELLPDGSVPPAPPHAPLGVDLEIPGDRPVYVLPGEEQDPRVIVYLHGMCGDVTAADYFREAVRAHGTLLAVRGDTACGNGRFKWRDDASKIQARIQAAFRQVNASRGGNLRLEGALLFGYSQGADRAEKLAARFPHQYRRIVLGGTPVKASPLKLARAERVAFLGGELETTDTMHAGHDALVAAGIHARFFTLDCAYHGYFGSRPEAQLTEALDWVTAAE